MLFSYITGIEPRPTIIESNKDETYHAKFARHYIGQANNHLHTKFLEKVRTNKNFYSGNQWTQKEDVEIFLKDDEGQERNRISLVDNIIRPMVEQYRGNAIRMGINFRVKSISPQAVNRREQQLAKTMFLSKHANKKDNAFAPDMKSRFPIGDSEGETIGIFNNTYVDKYVQKMNYLLKFVSERNCFEDKQVRMAEDLAFSGICVMKEFDYAGHQQFKSIRPETFFFDRNAREYDLSDASFMGEVIEMTPPEIFEMYPDISSDDRVAIENYVTWMSDTNKTQIASGQTNTTFSGRVPVYVVFWKDGNYDDYGYVLDEFGYEYLTKINYTYEGDDKPRYTDKDLIKGTGIRAKKLFGDKLKRKLYYDVARTAHIIPRELIGQSPLNKTENDKDGRDIVLEWGMYNYQETENQEYNSVKLPYKCYCWGYVDGEVLSPIDDAIDPQRFINRVWSVAENQINNSRGAGTVYDSSMVDDEAEMLKNMNQSKPVAINAKGRGIQNAVGAYDGTIKNGTLVMFNILDVLKSSTKQTTGVNEALNGESMGQDQLVGVTQLMIQRGSLMQEPFYYALVNVFKQCYQSICSRGKRIYIDSERNIAVAAGDDGAEIIRLSKEMRLEDFRCFVKRENTDEVLVSAGNQLLLQLKQLGYLDDKRFSNLWGRSSPDEVASGLREYAKEKEEIQRMASKNEQQQNDQLQQEAHGEQAQQQQMTHEAIARQDIKDLNDKRFEMKKENIKALSKLAPKSNQAKNILLNNAKNLDAQPF